MSPQDLSPRPGPPLPLPAPNSLRMRQGRAKDRAADLPSPVCLGDPDAWGEGDLQIELGLQFPPQSRLDLSPEHYGKSQHRLKLAKERISWGGRHSREWLCTCVCLHVCTHTHTHTCVPAHVHLCMYAYTCVHPARVFMHGCTQVCTCTVHLCMYICTCVCTHLLVHVCIHMHVRSHAHTCVQCIYACTRVCLCMCAHTCAGRHALMHISTHTCACIRLLMRVCTHVCTMHVHNHTCVHCVLTCVHARAYHKCAAMHVCVRTHVLSHMCSCMYVCARVCMLPRVQGGRRIKVMPSYLPLVQLFRKQ